MACDDAVHILLIEDDDIDVRALRRAFQKYGIINPLTVASNGLEGLQTLRGEGEVPPLPRPYLILLDINMPVMNGLAFLRALRQDAALCESVVFVLTSSDADRDVIAAHDQNIAGYIVKRDIGQDAMQLLTLLELKPDPHLSQRQSERV